ncbi:HNH endonuclease [Paenarthrobacter nicotinovorans]|uniref:HNH endonuclease n=1 Tax=Paenarthrobacter nicotinovorans TaxID=29320 RepID=UPI003D67C599
MSAGWGGSKSQRLSELVKQEYGWTCHLCLREISEDNYSVDHIIVRSKGGTDAIENLRPAHGKRDGICAGNYARGDKPIEQFRASQTDSRAWFLSLAP